MLFSLFYKPEAATTTAGRSRGRRLQLEKGGTERRGKWLGNAWTSAGLTCAVPEEEMGSPVLALTMARLGAPALEWDLECPCCFPLPCCRALAAACIHRLEG